MVTVIFARHLTMIALSLVMSFTLVGWGQEPSAAGRGEQGGGVVVDLDQYARIARVAGR